VNHFDADADYANRLLGEIEADLQAKRLGFALPLQLAPIDVLTSAIRRACKGGFGLWQDPPPVAAKGKAATHLYEINLLGLSALGSGPDDAARKWREAVLSRHQEAEA
jgi:hypothetical protein